MNVTDLPNELLVRLCTFFHADSMLRCQRVCRRLHDLICNNLDKMRTFSEDYIEIEGFGIHVNLSTDGESERELFYELREPVHGEDPACESYQPFAPSFTSFHVRTDTRSRYHERMYVRRCVLSTSEDPKSALRFLLNKLAERISITKVEIEKGNSEVLLICLQSFPQINTVSYPTGIFGESIDETKLEPVFGNSRISSLEIRIRATTEFISSAFFKSAFASQFVTSIVRDGEDSNWGLNFELDDEAIRNLRQLKNITLPKVSTETTVSAFADLVEAWNRGERKIEEVDVEVANSGIERANMYLMFHDCVDRGCFGESRHLLENNMRSQVLHLRITATDDFTVCWRIEIKKCREDEHRECECCKWADDEEENMLNE